MAREITEGKFKEWAKSNKYWCNKIQVDMSRLSSSGSFTRRQPADFMIANTFRAYLVECKEVLNGERFPFDRMRQESKLYKVSKETAIDGIVCINFISAKTIVMLPIEYYVEKHLELAKAGSKSITLNDIDEFFKFYKWSDVQIIHTKTDN